MIQIQTKKKKVILLSVTLVAMVLVAGCTVTNTNNSSSNQIQFPPSSQTNDVSKEITNDYASNGYTIIKPFMKAINQYGNVVYAGIIKEENATHLVPFQHNVTIELMKNKTETRQRVSQLATIYSKQGYAFPRNMTGTYIESDSTGDHQILMGGCDPNTICLSGLSIPFDQFIVVLDVQTKQA
jgi:hypothetical protein